MAVLGLVLVLAHAEHVQPHARGIIRGAAGQQQQDGQLAECLATGMKGKLGTGESLT